MAWHPDGVRVDDLQRTPSFRASCQVQRHVRRGSPPRGVGRTARWHPQPSSRGAAHHQLLGHLEVARLNRTPLGACVHAAAVLFSLPARAPIDQQQRGEKHRSTNQPLSPSGQQQSDDPKCNERDGPQPPARARAKAVGQVQHGMRLGQGDVERRLAPVREAPSSPGAARPPNPLRSSCTPAAP